MEEKAVEAEVLDELTRRADKAIARIIAETVSQAEETSREIEEVARILAERTGISMEQAVTEILNATRWMTCGIEEALKAVDLLFDGFQAQAKRSIKLALHAEREKWRAAERANIHRFHQYKAKENAWVIKKRTGKRRREWRGQWKDN